MHGSAAVAFKNEPAAKAPLAMAPDEIAPDATAPEAMAPLAIAPEAIAPDPTAPEAKAPDATAPLAIAPDAIPPDATLATTLLVVPGVVWSMLKLPIRFGPAGIAPLAAVFKNFNSAMAEHVPVAAPQAA